ncbi:hypothetical protein C0989_006930 [Termitomyces sp. Mn162]|nr:hypothetical protein C0989_006930 [Termitomyces sp. Mn162]
MEQSKSDTWSLGISPAITSTFKLSLIEGHSPSIDADPFSSRRCGLGWIYNIQATNADTTQPSSGGTERVKRTMFNLSFDAPRIATTSLNKLSFTVKPSDKTSPGVSKITVHVPDIPLPLSGNIHFASILSTSNFTGNIVVQIIVRLELSGSPTSGPPNFEHAFRGPTPPNFQLHSVVARSLLSGELGDVKFGLFTRRGGNDVTDPNVIFADATLLHGHNTFLINLLSTDNTEREVVNVGDLKSQVYSAYDYMSDSDLESDYNSDVDDLCDLDSQVSSLSGEDFPTRLKEVQSAHRKLEDHEKVIFIRDTAFATTALHSAEAREGSIACSPKSMYRLATKIKSKELQLLSLEAIIRNLSETNIIEELFSHFTSMYAEVQKAEVEALIPLLKQRTVVEGLLNKMNSVVTRGVPHCGAITTAVMGRVVELAVQGRQ